MHPDVVESRAGICPICRMKLEPVRLESAWSCPLHTAVVEADEGRCPICKRPLVPITVSLFWTCAGSTTREMSPGWCADGSERVAVRERRPHGDHNPRHGGVFFMAPDNWHHLEGTYPRAGVFRVFIYDDYTRPLPLAAVSGRAARTSAFDRASAQSSAATSGARASSSSSGGEADTYPLRASSDRSYLEARIPAGPVPAAITAKIRFTTSGEEYRFDFVFPSYSKEPRRDRRDQITTTAPAVAAGQAPGTNTIAPQDASRPAVPETTAGLLRELATQSHQVEALVLRGAFTEVWVPALSAKDLAVALAEHAGEMPVERRPRIASAAHRVVLAAWRLDLYGDLGNREQLTESYHAFAEAVQDLIAAYAKNP